MIPFSIRASTDLRALIGVPWVSGGRDAARGLDCWGLIMDAARKLYAIELPDYPGYQNADQPEETKRYFAARDGDNWRQIGDGEERAGDVIVLRLGGVPAHAGLVIERGLMLHSLRGRNACIEHYHGRHWALRIEGFYRWAPR